jgi:predicted small lipoprotein YifL
MLVAALGLAGCGRKAALDPPPAAATPAVPQEGALAPAQVDNGGGIDDEGRPSAPQGTKKRLLLDWLID